MTTFGPITQNGPTRTLFIRHRLGFIHASYWVRAVHEPQVRRVRFRLDRDHPSSLRDAWGELRVTEFEHHRSVVSLAIMTSARASNAASCGNVVRPVKSQVVPRTRRAW